MKLRITNLDSFSDPDKSPLNPKHAPIVTNAETGERITGIKALTYHWEYGRLSTVTITLIAKLQNKPGMGDHEIGVEEDFEVETIDHKE